MTTESTHTGSFQRDAKGDIVRAMYRLSKWEKKIGDPLIFDGKKTTIEIIGDSRDQVIRVMNAVIKKQNIRLKNNR